MAAKKETDDALEALDVNVDSSTRTIKAQFRRKARDLQNSRAAGTPASKKSFEELNEAYQTLMEARKKGHAAPTKSVTILSSDVAGYSRMMATNEAETLEFFNFCKEVFEEIVADNQGRVFNTAGDAILAEFEYVFNAIHCAVEIQKELRAINLGQPEDKRVLFRMGINKGEVFMQEGDLLGDAVNIAARLQTAAKPGGICLSGEIYDQVANKVTHGFTSLGKLTFKNIPEPVRTYALTEDDRKFKPPLPNLKATPFEAPAPAKSKQAKPQKSEGNGLTWAVLLAVAVAGGSYFWFRAPSSQQAAPSPAAQGTAPAKPAGTSEIGHVFLATTPDSDITMSQGGQPKAKGRTPLDADLPTGTYQVHYENKDLDILVDEELQVSPGKNRIEKTLPTKSVTGSLNGFAGGGPSQLSPDELSMKMRAEEQKDYQAAFGLGLSRIQKGKPEEAYPYLTTAAAHEHGQAQIELAKLFYSGTGVPKRDFEAALYWGLKAVLNGRKEPREFLMNNKFPPEYKVFVQNALKIVNGDKNAERARSVITLELEELQGMLKEKGLPY